MFKKGFIKKYFLKCFSIIITYITVTTVNSACVIAFGQEYEPDSLKKFKRIK